MSSTAEQDLIEWLASVERKPYDFVLGAFPWGEPGTELEKRLGPEPWQTRLLQDLQAELISPSEAIRFAVRSGHGVGKSAMVSWVIWWAMSTASDTRGRVTANTEKQLLRTLWPEVAKWHRLFIGKDLFKVTATAVIPIDPDRERNWRIDAIPWSEDNPEAFAGLHNYGKRILVICDEASAIPNVIWETLDGATLDADTEIVWLVCGNPTKAVGRFRDCFESRKTEWHSTKVDSRDVSFTNKSQIERAIERYGIDNDFVRVRYLGEFPSVEASALIAPETISAAQSKVPDHQPWEPLILALDVARYGTNESVAIFRRGKDARCKPLSRWRGLSVIELGTRIAALISREAPDAVFIDEGGVGGGVVDFVRSLGHPVYGVNFGSRPGGNPGGVLVANKRAEMYVLLKEWLREGGAIPAEPDLYDQLAAIEYYIQERTQAIILVSKEDMTGPSPDIADALAMTFALPVALSRRSKGKALLQDYDPLSQAALQESFVSASFGSMH
jgi:hypothetical protein